MRRSRNSALAACFLSFVSAAFAAEPLKVGDPAPNAKSLDQDGRPVSLASLYGAGWTLVYFFPKADTPGCTAEACSLRDAFADLTKKGVTVIGVSADAPADQNAFRDKYHLPFMLLADKDKNVIRAFGVPTTMGFASRQSFLIKDGKIVWRDLHASTKEQAADILKAVSAG